MNKIIYLISNAEPLQRVIEQYNAKDSIQEKMEKTPLSIKGEKQAEKISCSKELGSIALLYSSPYVRAISTAKYIASRCDISIQVDEALSERKQGNLVLLDRLDFVKRQQHDFDFKVQGGESYNDVKRRILKLISNLLEEEAEEICLLTHRVAIEALLSEWCEIGYNLDDKLILNYNGKSIIDTYQDDIDMYKITFNDGNIMKLEKISI